MIEAVCTKPMRWLAILHAKLKHIGDTTAIDVYGFVALSFCRPVFAIHNLLFQLVYAAQIRRVTGLIESALCFKKTPLNLDHRLIDSGFGFERLEPLRDVQSALNRVVSTLDRLNHLPLR